MREPRSVVIDSSVALALLLDEPEAVVVDRALRAWIRAGRALVVPSHFWLEVLNRLGRDPGSLGDRMLAAMHRLDSFDLETVEPGRPLLLFAIDRVERHGLTAYDALYLALAESTEADLATLDRKLGSAAGPRAITFDESQGLHEPPAVYEHDVTWPSYKGASAYLAKLRSEALAERG
jgi:predicted nucleic acid-binding protein